MFLFRTNKANLRVRLLLGKRLPNTASIPRFLLIFKERKIRVSLPSTDCVTITIFGISIYRCAFRFSFMGTSLGTDTANMKTLDTYKSSLHKSREEK